MYPLPILFFLRECPPLRKDNVNYMSEAIISRRGYDANGKPELRTEIITGTTNWTVPNSIRNTTISVRIFGGGVYMSNGGGSGWMNNGEITVTPGQKIDITIGNSGSSSGGTTSFGTYLSANGGSLHNGGAGGGSGGRGYQFGGGGGYATIAGGDGGMWGGGGGGGTSTNQNNRAIGSGGNGGTYGGGGGGATACRSGMVIKRGGNGGTYGGGGGSGVVVTHRGSTITPMDINGIGKNNYSIGGEYGGNGGSVENGTLLTYDTVNLNKLINDNTRTNPSNGTNTMGNLSIPSNLRGYGRAGSGTTITLKGNDISLPNFRDSMMIPSGGGGGYGGNGGSGVSISDTTIGTIRAVVVSGGGGGGYGGDGGRSASDADSYDSVSKVSGGGGGGYGSKGGNGHSMNSSNINTLFGGGGGGYFSDAWYSGGGGYYNYCHGGGTVDNSSFGYGSGGVSIAKGGACILEYWI